MNMLLVVQREGSDLYGIALATIMSLRILALVIKVLSWEWHGLLLMTSNVVLGIPCRIVGYVWTSALRFPCGTSWDIYIIIGCADRLRCLCICVFLVCICGRNARVLILGISWCTWVVVGG